MTSRNSRARIRTSQSVSRANSVHSVKRDKKEVVYFICDAHAFSRKTLKPNDAFSQEEVQDFLHQKPRARPQSYKLYLLEDRIRFKPRNLAIRSHLHPTVLYRDIKGAFALTERPKWLILCILYPSSNKRKIESFFFSNEESATRVSELLVQVKRNPEQMIEGIQPIGFVSTGSLRSLSRPSLSTQSGTNGLDYRRSSSSYMPKLDDEEYSECETIDNLRSQATSPIVYPLMLSNSPILVQEPTEMVSKYRKVNKAFVRVPQDDYTRDYVIQLRQEPEDNSVLTQRSSQTLMALGDQIPGSLIFINNSPSKGIHVTDDGPVYMFCQVEQ